MYTANLTKTNEISFNTLLLVTAYYVYRQYVTLKFSSLVFTMSDLMMAETCRLHCDTLHHNKSVVF